VNDTSIFVHAIAASHAHNDRIEANQQTTDALWLLSVPKVRPGLRMFGDRETLSTSGQRLSTIGLVGNDGRVQTLDPLPERISPAPRRHRITPAIGSDHRRQR
jgi:hypothetical protein